jgi:hypothetical protein
MADDEKTTMGKFMTETFARNTIMAHLDMYTQSYGISFSDEFKDKVFNVYEETWYDYYLNFVKSLELDVHSMEQEDGSYKHYLPKEEVDGALIKVSLLGFISQIIILELVGKQVK